MTTDRYTTMRLETYGPDGLIVNPDQGSIPGERIDDAVRGAVDRFWSLIAESFPEAQFGDMAPGDDLEFNDAALRVARIWVMHNVPGGMPEEDDGFGPDDAVGRAFRFSAAIDKAMVEDVKPGTPEWDESERALIEQRRKGG